MFIKWTPTYSGFGTSILAYSQIYLFILMICPFTLKCFVCLWWEVYQRGFPIFHGILNAYQHFLKTFLGIFFLSQRISMGVHLCGFLLCMGHHSPYRLQILVTKKTFQEKIKSRLASTNPVFLPMSGVGNEVCNLGTEVFPNDASHVMNQIHQVFLR